MTILKDFGLRLRELRTQTGMSQDTLACRSGLDRSYIGSVERGERNVSLRNIEILCDTLDVDISYFFDSERFSLQRSFLKRELDRPLAERFSYIMDKENNLIAWRVTGALHPDEVKRFSLDLKAACRQLESKKVKLLIDNSKMMTKGQPIAFQYEVTEKWEELQRWFLPHCEQVTVLCNSKFMQNQMNRLAKRSGIIKVQRSIYSEDKEWHADGESDLIDLLLWYYKV
ncbi:transcriptional regulator with XRE-family HTH domain [Paenibacillus endophyticus]|uniref:Transcriptional regulator with XRE-family HTH domain n=1 Tax=Paenibacillus endophyticus TaxID=1294268 RepID=A0A7W5CAB7_9BACL|nr:helix-turn-helix transcriptional regulator [Paenibacillus endophyticus]MBB3153937.1 transcriptional regulator with XRE-family HTH domain [Paenibacillus endophyticus]